MVTGKDLPARRDCLRVAAVVSGGLATGTALVAAGALPRRGDGTAVPVRIADRIARGQAVAFAYPGPEDRALAVRLADGTLVGHSAVCTHLACALVHRPGQGPDGDLHCPCHGGGFDVRTGEVTGGPPPRALPKVLLTEDARGAVWAVGTARPGEDEQAGLCRGLRARDPDTADRIGCEP
ncbi:ubiquinol-cytochrome c reductase iron-sulfur subunit [Kitasatospora sp. KL5]|uniref:QcrA and Rieske domain-containing protein n=1 Tax=Kitasatospora sp. KL5 TaxID=3425125 RepID=UPI003D701CD4